MAETLIENKMLPHSSVSDITTLSKTQLLRLAKLGDFPAPIRLSPRRIAWKASDVAQWLKDRFVTNN